MPLTCASGASVSISAISAPQPAATTTPVSSRRVVVHGARSAPVRARPNTSSVDASAPPRARRRDQRRRAREHRPERADRGAAGDAEDVRIGERIAQQHLHQRAGEREQTADGESGERARQAQFAHDGRRRSPTCRRRARGESPRPSTSTLPTASASASAASAADGERGEDRDTSAREWRGREAAMRT